MCGEILMRCDTDLSGLAPTAIEVLREPDLACPRCVAQIVRAIDEQ